MTPVRIRLSRQRGFKLQVHSVAVNGLSAMNVARPTLFGNPFTIEAAREAGYRPEHCASMAVYAHRQWLDGHPNFPGPTGLRDKVLARIHELRGRNIACWCALDAPCHGNTLLELANGESET